MPVLRSDELNERMFKLSASFLLSVYFPIILDQHIPLTYPLSSCGCRLFSQQGLQLHQKHLVIFSLDLNFSLNRLEVNEKKSQIIHKKLVR